MAHVTLEVLKAQLDAHAEKDEVQLTHVNEQLTKVDKTLSDLSTKISANSKHVHSRFDNIMRCVLFIALSMVASMAAIIYNTLKVIPGGGG